ncbi:MAG: hypothetical protein CL480_02930 [Acidobacteria bacterium]|nr:hypothetical protein [Acidobacteriota bacterium]
MSAGPSTRLTTTTPLTLTALIFMVGCASAPPEQATLSTHTPPVIRSVVDGVFTNRQAARGQRSFERICEACHRTREFRGSAFQQEWAGRPLGDLLQLLVSTMPPNDPGFLELSEYRDIVSYMLRQNGYPAGETELPADASILMNIRFNLRGGM